LLTVILLVCAHATAQQKNCPLRLDQLQDAPELRGFRLGMTYDQVKARVPPIQFGRPDEIGVAKTSINPNFDPRFDKSGFADVRTISFDFLDGKLVTLWIGYDPSFKWQTLDDFVAGMGRSLNLPAAWSQKRGGQQMTCEGFSIFASIIAGSPSLRITDETAQETITTRREEAVAAAEAAVTGDVRTKLYYPSDCSARDSLPEASRVIFKDKDEAEKAGYKLAKDCQ
jgi:hypothetical protein